MFVMVYILSNMVIQIQSNRFKQGVQMGKSLVAEQCLIMSDCHTFPIWTRLDINTRLLPKENFREPFGLPKLKVRSPSHIFRSPELILRYQTGINHYPPVPPTTPPLNKIDCLIFNWCKCCILMLVTGNLILKIGDSGHENLLKCTGININLH